MGKRDDQATARVQVYFENPKTELALRREARAGKLTLSRAAERAIERGLQKKPGAADPDELLRAVDRALKDHMRSTRRDMAWMMEIQVAFARAFFLRLPDRPMDADPDLRAAAEICVERLLDDVAARLERFGLRNAEPAPAESCVAANVPAPELRSFQMAAE